MKFIWWLVGVTLCKVKVRDMIDKVKVKNDRRNQKTRSRTRTSIDEVDDVVDDVAYPADVLKRAQRAGVNTTGIPIAKEFQVI